jgi:hypothetical protein
LNFPKDPIDKQYYHLTDHWRVGFDFGSQRTILASQTLLKNSTYRRATPMKKIQIVKRSSAMAASLLFCACLPHAHSQTLVYKDVFAGAAQNLDAAPTTGISGLDGTGSGALPQSAAIESTIDGAGNLDLQTPGADGSGDSGYIRFDTIGATSTLYNWAASPAATAITNAGGMVVSFDWTANDTTGDNWLYFAAGADPADNFGYGFANVIWSANTASGILLANNGTVQTFHSSATPVTSGSFSPTGDVHVVDLIYSFNSWAAGAPVSLTAIVDGSVVISSDTFDWNSAESGANYLNLGTYQETNAVSDFAITTIPEPGTYSIVVLGIGTLLVWRRTRRG